MEKSHFDVLQEPWIPVTDLNGARFELGIIDTLLRAPYLQEISDASPMVEFGLYRLLSVFLMDLYRPKTKQDIRQLWKRGKFCESELRDYLALCQQEGVSFDLFDENRPFLQTPYVAEWDKESRPAAAIDKTIPSGNNHTHFDHRKVSAISFSYAEAARRLVPLQLFCTAGVQGYASGTSGAPPYYAMIHRETLFETLLFSILPEERLPNHLHFAADSGGNRIPVFWRNREVVESKREIVETSFLYGMLFPARRILLIPDANTASVARVYLSPGFNYKVVTNWTDPSAAYRKTNKGISSVKPDTKEPIWRNLSALINVPEKTAPLLLENAEDLDRHALSFDIALYGVQTNQASYIDAIKYDLRIPVGLLEDVDKNDAIKAVIQKASEIAKYIRSGFREKRNGQEYSTISGVSAQAVKELENRMAIREEPEFWRISEKLAQQDADIPGILQEWILFLIACAKEEIHNMERTCELRGSALARLAEKEMEIFRKLRKVEEEYGT